MFGKLSIDYRIRVHSSFPTGSKPIAEIKVLFPLHTLSPLTWKKKLNKSRLVVLIKTIKYTFVRLPIFWGPDFIPRVSDPDLSLWLTKKVSTWKWKWTQPFSSSEENQGKFVLTRHNFFKLKTTRLSCFWPSSLFSDFTI